MGQLFKGLLVGVLALLLVIFLGSVIFDKAYPFPAQVKYGVSFSPRHAEYLKLDWQETYVQILDNLKVKSLRIPSYWDVLESKIGEYNFSETDYMLSEAEKRGARVILVLGMRQPRWPECHIPSWAKNLGVRERQQKVLEFIRQVVERYKANSAIWAWQVENEPFLAVFGEGCDRPDAGFLQSEIDLVRSLSSKVIIGSDSGELGSWIVPMQVSDIFGTTLYREVYNPVMGYFTYPILPYLYNIKSQIVRGVFAPKNQKTIIVELQAEPWLSNGDSNQNIAQQLKRFPLDKMKAEIDYAKKTGFDEMYLWGVEWWYFMSQNGHLEYLEYAKSLFK